MKEDHNSILWITGKPGTGKSTLLSHIIQNLEDRTVEIPRTTVASFFFNEPQDTTYTTAGSLLQSFVFQILSQIPSAMSDFIPLLSQQRDFFTTLDESGDKWRPWTSKNLNGLFENYLIKISETHRLCFFVDALDECPEEDSSGILSLLSSIDSSLLKNPIKLCITSRPHRYLEASYRPRHRRIILENENTADIQRFIRFRIAQFPKRKREELILNEILEKASGVFLWAKIVVDVLKHLKGTIEMLESSLWDIPSDLGGLYRFVLDRFIYDEHRSADLAKRLLKLVCYARRPLSVEEMSHALGVDASLQVIRSDSSGAAVNSEPALLAVDKNWLLAHCWGLVEVREPGVKIHLVHQTIREYLVNTVSVETGWEEDPKCHTFRSADIDLAEICLSYLSFDAYTGRIDGKSIQKEADGLLDYATDYWHEHARLADHRDSSNMVLLKLLNWPSTKVLGHWAHLHQKKVGNGTPSDYWGWTVLHASAAFGLHNLALAIRDVERSDLMRWDVGDAVGRTPLSLAAKKGDLSLVKLFLDAGSSIATRDIGHGFSPLLWAASQGHQKVVELLLQEGADADDNVGGTTALLLAAGGGHGAALEALLDKGANPNLADKRYGWTPLHLSAGYGDEAVVSLLLAHGADPNLVNPFTKRMPLYYATAGGHQEVVRLLLDHGGGMQQPTLGPVPTIPIFWADRVACSFLIPLDSDPSCQPSACTSSKTNVTSSPDGSAILRQTGDNSKKASKKRLRDVSESGSGGGLGGSGNDPNKHPTLNPTPSLSSNGPGLRLACPYHKYDPGRYGSQKPCRGPVGWPSINRVKYDTSFPTSQVGEN